MKDYISLEAADAQINPTNGQLVLIGLNGNTVWLSWADFQSLMLLYKEAGVHMGNLPMAPSEGW